MAAQVVVDNKAGLSLTMKALATSVSVTALAKGATREQDVSVTVIISGWEAIDLGKLLTALGGMAVE